MLSGVKNGNNHTSGLILYLLLVNYSNWYNLFRVDGNYIIKIADFGMSRDIYGKDYYKLDGINKPLPLKWMAVESLMEGKYSTKSDVVCI